MSQNKTLVHYPPNHFLGNHATINYFENGVDKDPFSASWPNLPIPLSLQHTSPCPTFTLEEGRGGDDAAAVFAVSELQEGREKCTRRCKVGILTGKVV